MNRFWDLETIGICEKEIPLLYDFYDSIYLNDWGRYEVRLPFKTGPILKSKGIRAIFQKKSKNRQNSGKFGKKSKKIENILNSQERMTWNVAR